MSCDVVSFTLYSFGKSFAFRCGAHADEQLLHVISLITWVERVLLEARKFH